MKKIYFTGAIVFLIIIGTLYSKNINSNQEKTEELEWLDDVIVTQKQDTIIDSTKNETKLIYVSDEWDIFLTALSWVESRHTDDIIGKYDNVNSTGRYQITPIFVKEINQQLGYEKYSLKDRYNPILAANMVTDMNKIHNPNFDLNKAIKLHNPTAGENYKNKILTKYYELL